MKSIRTLDMECESNNIEEVIDSMYEYILAYATKNNMKQTLKALPYAKKMHNGQFRKSKGNIPYIYHPLIISCQAITIGLDEDEVIATALLHDVCEDCGASKEELPVNTKIQDAVWALTKDINMYTADMNAETMYYDNISHNRYACIVKILDRCNNISDMVTAFSKEKIIDYIDNTMYYVYPLFDAIEKNFSEYVDKAFVIKYHMSSVIKGIRSLIN